MPHTIVSNRFAPLLTLVLMTGAFALPANAHIKDDPESLRSMLGIVVDGHTIDEVAFSPTQFRIVTTRDRSLVTFRVRDAVFSYTLRGPSHVQEARALIQALHKKQFRAIVDVQPTRSEKFTRFFDVHAISAMQTVQAK